MYPIMMRSPLLRRKMEQLAPKEQYQFKIGEVFQLDEDVLERLNGRGKQGLSETTKEAYRQVIRDFNRFVYRNRVAINEESVQAYFESISHRLH